MKYLILFAFSASLYFSSCDTFSEYPAEDCFISYTLDGVEFSQDSVGFYYGYEAGNLRILHNFDNSGSMSIISNDWEPAIGEVEASFIAYGTTSNLYLLKKGTINVTVLEKNYFSGTFVDGDGFIKNGSFTLRYSEL